MRKTRYRGLMVYGIILLFGITFSTLKLINAMTDYAQDLPSSYGSSCQVCHLSASGGGDLNSFGSDFSENDNDIEAINELDSDGDGYTNEEELNAGTFPGDPDSKPISYGNWENIALIAVGLALVVGIVVIKFRAN